MEDGDVKSRPLDQNASHSLPLLLKGLILPSSLSCQAFNDGCNDDDVIQTFLVLKLLNQLWLQSEETFSTSYVFLSLVLTSEKKDILMNESISSEDEWVGVRREEITKRRVSDQEIKKSIEKRDWHAQEEMLFLSLIRELKQHCIPFLKKQLLPHVKRLFMFQWKWVQ